MHVQNSELYFSHFSMKRKQFHACKFSLCSQYISELGMWNIQKLIEFQTLKFDTTGSSIYMWTHSFNLTCSHERSPSNFKTSFICYYTEFYFEVYNSFLGQLAQKWRLVKVLSPKQKYLEKVHFTSLTDYNLIFFANFGLAAT